MQLGTRWVFGQEPPSQLPEAVVAAIREVEAGAQTTLNTVQSSQGSPNPVEHVVRRWTLTWLEGKPHVELDPESGSNEVTEIRFDPKRDKAHVTTSDPDVDWVEE